MTDSINPVRVTTYAKRCEHCTETFYLCTGYRRDVNDRLMYFCSAYCQHQWERARNVHEE